MVQRSTHLLSALPVSLNSLRILVALSSSVQALLGLTVVPIVARIGITDGILMRFDAVVVLISVAPTSIVDCLQNIVLPVSLNSLRILVALSSSVQALLGLIVVPMVARIEITDGILIRFDAVVVLISVASASIVDCLQNMLDPYCSSSSGSGKYSYSQRSPSRIGITDGILIRFDDVVVLISIASTSIVICLQNIVLPMSLNSFRILVPLSSSVQTLLGLTVVPIVARIGITDGILMRFDVVAVFISVASTSIVDCLQKMLDPYCSSSSGSGKYSSSQRSPSRIGITDGILMRFDVVVVLISVAYTSIVDCVQNMLDPYCSSSSGSGSTLLLSVLPVSLNSLRILVALISSVQALLGLTVVPIVARIGITDGILMRFDVVVFISVASTSIVDCLQNMHLSCYPICWIFDGACDRSVACHVAPSDGSTLLLSALPVSLNSLCILVALSYSVQALLGLTVVPIVARIGITDGILMRFDVVVVLISVASTSIVDCLQNICPYPDPLVNIATFIGSTLLLSTFPMSLNSLRILVALSSSVQALLGLIVVIIVARIGITDGILMRFDVVVVLISVASTSIVDCLQNIEGIAKPHIFHLPTFHETMAYGFYGVFAFGA
ncbi:hypothetical protein KIW84_071338 [Lathyrus oleraceus]|uniref:Uncharacterized protein n=1 Tax=Pisum sativum TaxID=3888 RepID=A0A9D4VKA1_PEA|nr:hypothetical protein KIW84_071338 [Pisum sativum]